MDESPIAISQRLTKPDLPKRFYETAAWAETPEGFVVLLDGRPARTPGRALLVFPDAALAAAAAAEWAGQGGSIDPASMPLTRLANTAIDAVAPSPEPVRADCVKFARSDLVCYRAGEPEGLVASQSEHWDAVLAWVRTRYGARFVLSEGVMFVEQPPETIAAIAEALAGYDGLRLTALHTMTTLTGSLLLALAVAEGQLDVEAAWAAAHVDEDWNILHWGEDAEAAERRSLRFQDMRAAALAVR